jgi:SAM-dependent methyltransferase
MHTPQDILASIPADRVLDVATGSGGFIHFLLEGLKGYTEIIGVDSNERAVQAFAEAFKDKPNIHFQAMDAARLDFEPESFDLVCVSNSLHHIDDPLLVLRQMERVLRPGGHLLVSEMYCDGQTETQMTHVHLHHWWAAVDTVNRVVHHETYRRGQLIELVSSLGLRETALYDLLDISDDPRNPEISDELNPVFERYIQRAEGHPALQARGEELRQRVAEVGFHSASTLVIVGKKNQLV